MTAWRRTDNGVPPPPCFATRDDTPCPDARSRGLCTTGVLISCPHDSQLTFSFPWLTESLPVTQHRPTRRRLQPAVIIRAAIVVLDVPRERLGKSKKPRAYVRSLVGGDRGIRTLEPLNTTNTLAGCPYRPLRHDSTVALRRNSM